MAPSSLVLKLSGVAAATGLLANLSSPEQTFQRGSCSFGARRTERAVAAGGENRSFLRAARRLGFVERGVMCQASVATDGMEHTRPTIVEAKEEASALPDLLTEFMVDMKCDGCVKNVKKQLEPLPGVKSVLADLPSQVVRVLSNVPLKDLEAALAKSGRKSRLIGQGDPALLSLTAAVAEFKGPAIFGVARFAQVSSELARIEARFDGLPPGRHAWSVNEFGDLTKGAESTGGVFNVEGGSEQEPAAGDLFILEADEAGHVEYSGTSTRLKVWDLIGRAVVVYGTEDLSGPRLAGSVIARSAGVGENYKSICSCDGTVIWEATPNDYVQQKS